MKVLRLVPDGTKIGFMRLWRVMLPISVVLSIASLVAFFTVGPNYGIDFKGGSVIEITTTSGKPADLAELRNTVGDLNLGDVQIQEFGRPDDVLIRIARQEGGDEAQQRAVFLVRDALGDGYDITRTEVVGPRVSGELARNGTLGLVVTLAAIMVYVWFRFEWQFAVGAIIATLHDVILTLGIYTLVPFEFNLSSIAAILTIVGYSLNDTVVVYDRIRENLRKYKKMPIADLIDLSVNETLGRTMITSITTLIALISLYVFGGEVIRSFVFAMIFGVVVGTFSSIYIAAPVLIYFRLRTGRPNNEEGAAAATGAV
ncbi:protein translocase subunit SecF [Pseudoxanthobacter sp.]|uniref:protein translocase subunit SecF n=1 Tax=Pseudoxanthobacter sp. TaxID=1925742 RepID=UPI002FE39662